MLDLVVVMPVYNEAGIIGKVVVSWVSMLETLGITYELRVYNDGSKDGTTEILDNLAGQYGTLRVFHKPNSGHGPTLMMGYAAAARDAAWVFQTDSDNEISADIFPSFWRERAACDLVVACRKGRIFSWSRRLTTGVSFWTVRLLFGKGVDDVNVPYRLMRAPVLAGFLAQIPAEMMVPNVVLTGLFCRRGKGIYVIPAAYAHRQTGVVSIRHWKLLRFAVWSFIQTLQCAGRYSC
ncbi:MAG: glycosyltransferase family 2 protein [Candidatus Omnitrophota bacterium]